MSIGSLGIIGGIAATPTTQRAAETDRTTQVTSQAQRHAQSALQAENAAGIAETDGSEHGPSERDADGRRLWEIAAEKKTPPDEAPATETPPRPHDPKGESGNQLDLVG